MSIYRKKSQRLSKKLAERRHCAKRALQRYRIKLTKRIRIRIVQSIEHEEAQIVRRISNRLTVWRVSIPGYPELKVVYDKKRKEVVTFLPN